MLSAAAIGQKDDRNKVWKDDTKKIDILIIGFIGVVQADLHPHLVNRTVQYQNRTVRQAVFVLSD